MYLEHFNLREFPFNITPDIDYFTLNKSHVEGLAHLKYILTNRTGFVLLTGEVGTGKTTLCRILLSQLPNQAKAALILNPSLTEIDLLASICDELRIPYDQFSFTIKNYIDSIYQYLLAEHQQGHQVLLIIDEAQSLQPRVMELVRLLTNIETEKEKLLQIILVGQPELLEILTRHEMRQINQRITARYHLRPLDKDEVYAYIRQRIKKTGGWPGLFSRRVSKLIWSASGGIPRLVNVICEHCLLAAYAANQDQINVETARKSINEALGENVSNTRAKKIIVMTVILIFIIFFMMFVFNKNQLNFDIIKTSITLAGKSGSALFKWQNNDNVDANSAEMTQNNQNSIKKEKKSIVASDVVVVDSKKSSSREIIPLNAKLPVNLVMTSTGVSSTVEYTPPPFVKESFVTIPIHEKQKKLTPLEILLSDIQFSTEYNESFQKLLSAWNLTPDSTVEPCQQAKAAGLECLKRNSNLSQLKRYNRPAVIAFTAQGNIVYCFISKLNDSEIILDFGSTIRTIPLNEAEQLWNGTMTLLWKRPAEFAAEKMREGDQGSHVLKLREKLAALLGGPSNGSKIYDTIMTDMVKAFQRKNGLTADGVTGIETLLALYQNEPASPVLR